MLETFLYDEKIKLMSEKKKKKNQFLKIIYIPYLE